MAPIEQLVRRVLDGESAAWTQLQGRLKPEVEAMARRHHGLRQKGLADQPDDLAEVVIATFERLARDEYRNLRRFDEQANAAGTQPASFDSWLYGAVDFVIREHLRRRFGRAPKLKLGSRVLPSKRELQSQAGRLDEHAQERSFLVTMGMTLKLTAAEIMAHVEREFSEAEARALRLYYHEDSSFAEIARALELEGEASAEKLIRRLNARLRYRFMPSS